MEKNRISFVILTGILLAAGIFFAGCDFLGSGSTASRCSGNGECTVTIDQGPSGLYVDYNSPRSSCGKSATYNYDTSSYRNGCKVQENMDGRNRTYGTHGCNC